jgi:hypothetical protein
MDTDPDFRTGKGASFATLIGLFSPVAPTSAGNAYWNQQRGLLFPEYYPPQVNTEAAALRYGDLIRDTTKQFDDY